MNSVWSDWLWQVSETPGKFKVEVSHDTVYGDLGIYNLAMPSVLALPALVDGDLRLEMEKVSPHPVHKVQTYFFRMVGSSSEEEVGRINLRLGSGQHIERYAGHIGYFVEPVRSRLRFTSFASVDACRPRAWP